MGRDSVVGYGSVLIPTQSGQHARVAHMYAPQPSSMLQRFRAWISGAYPEVTRTVVFIDCRGPAGRPGLLPNRIFFFVAAMRQSHVLSTNDRKGIVCGLFVCVRTARYSSVQYPARIRSFLYGSWSTP